VAIEAVNNNVNNDATNAEDFAAIDAPAFCDA
jgi:hypothetical protein